MKRPFRTVYGPAQTSNWLWVVELAETGEQFSVTRSTYAAMVRDELTTPQIINMRERVKELARLHLGDAKTLAGQFAGRFEVKAGDNADT